MIQTKTEMLYETSLQCQLSMTLKELRDFKAERLKISELVDKAIEERDKQDADKEFNMNDRIGPHGGIGPP